MKCPYCGIYFIDGERECPVCGRRIPTGAAKSKETGELHQNTQHKKVKFSAKPDSEQRRQMHAADAPPSPPLRTFSAKPKQKSGGRGCLVGVLLLLLLFSLFGGLFGLVFDAAFVDQIIEGVNSGMEDAFSDPSENLQEYSEELDEVPKELVGTWKSEDTDLTFEFRKNGQVRWNREGFDEPLQATPTVVSYASLQEASEEVISDIADEYGLEQLAPEEYTMYEVSAYNPWNEGDMDVDLDLRLYVSNEEENPDTLVVYDHYSDEYDAFHRAK